MNLIQDRRVLLAGGAGAALLAGVLIAVFLTGKRDPAPEAAPAKGALQVELGEQPKVDPNQQLRCFVGGQFIGSATLADCARKNGVAAQALDVGIDASGALAAGGESLKPLPQVAAPQVAVAAAPSAPVMQAAPTLNAAPVGECLRYGADGWRPAGTVTQAQCVQTLFDGRCQAAGQALYGRWGSQTLRLVPGKVEASPDNRTFHTVVEQRSDCSIPAS
jgi:hypothetical protein